MKQITYILLWSLTCLFMASCTEDIETPFTQRKGVVRVIPRISELNDINVSTRSVKNDYEKKVTSLYMFVFDSNGGLVDVQRTSGDNRVFVIDTQNEKAYTDHTQSLLEQARICVVANLPENVIGTTESIKSNTSFNRATLEAIDFDNTQLDIERDGFPLYGISDAVDLRKERPDTGSSDEQITLLNLFAKITFNIRVVADQVSANHTPQFQLTGYKIYNTPVMEEIGAPDADEQTTYCAGTMQPIIEGDMSEVTMPIAIHNSEAVSFYCYVPEHKVIPANPDGTNVYPPKLPDDQKQRYKPLLCGSGQKPTYVKLEGVYTDHNGINYNVTYDVYLGANNYNDYFICRNYNYINNITIKGIVNSKDSAIPGNPDNISVDHRVNVEGRIFTFGIERETQLDSHWEIRPIRIDFNDGEGVTSKVEITVPSGCNWISIESPASPSGNTYCDVGNTSTAYGKRRYFTTNLVSSLTTKTITIAKNSTNHTIANLNGKNIHTVWVYIDENTTTNDRSATITCKYYPSTTATTPTVQEDYIFNQKGLFTVSNGGRSYNIEYYEEYLYNYDTKEQYGNTTDGMEWGLNGLQISDTNNALLMDNVDTDGSNAVINFLMDVIQDIFDAICKNIAEKSGAKYDFYLDRDENLLTKALTNPITEITTRNYQGQTFTKEIIEEAKNQNRTDFKAQRPTNEMPQSAVEYCYNKNKRDTNGNVTNIEWFLPSIDQIEDITIGGYQTFDVFQNKLYWSSQPAYKEYYADYLGTYTCKLALGTKIGVGTATSSGYFYKDDTNRARATKVYTNDGGTTYIPENSGTTGQWGKMTCTDVADIRVVVITNRTTTYPETTYDNPTITYDPGNCERTGEIHRIRCVYKAASTKK